jgi:hypothetical protein
MPVVVKVLYPQLKNHYTEPPRCASCLAASAVPVQNAVIPACLARRGPKNLLTIVPVANSCPITVFLMEYFYRKNS